jgi:hypothetical protein
MLQLYEMKKWLFAFTTQIFWNIPFQRKMEHARY